MKTCTKCGDEKSPEEFSRNRNARDGRVARCKACVREYMRAYNRNPAQLVRATAFNQARDAADPEGARAYRRAHSRVKRARGRAADQGVCTNPGCERPALDWALDPSHPTVERSPRFAWSDAVTAYRPKCRGCNKTEDFAATREVSA